MRPSKTISASDPAHRGIRHPVRPRITPLIPCFLLVMMTTFAMERITWTAFINGDGVDGRSVSLAVALLVSSLAVSLVTFGAAHRLHPVDIGARGDGADPGMRAPAGGPVSSRPWSALKIAPIVAMALSLLLATAGIDLLYWGWWARTVRGLAADMGGHRTVRVVSDVRAGVYGETSDGEVLVDGSYLPIVICWQEGTVPIASGHTMGCYGEVTPVRATGTAHRRHEEGIVGMLRAFNCEDEGTSADLRGLVSPLRCALRGSLSMRSGRGEALIRGLVLGDRGGLAGSDLDVSFRLCGLSHLVAVSGSHLAIVAGLVDAVVRRTHLPRGVRAAVLFTALLLYTLLSGLQISASRAFVMCAIGLGAGLVGRRAYPLGAAGLCGMAMVLIEPPCMFSLSFQLSFAAVVGVIVFTPLLTEWLVVGTLSLLRTPMEMLAITFAAQATTLPITVPRFSMLPLLSPLANLVVAPLVSVLIAAGLTLLPLSCLLPRPFASMVVGLLDALAEGVCALVGALARLPGISVPTSFGQGISILVCSICLGALWYLWPRPTRRGIAVVGVVVSALALVAAFFWASPWTTRFVMLDVGQGDALLFTCGRHALLVDTGGQDARLLSELARNRVRHLDAVVITHLHDDHYGSLDALRGNVVVDRVLLARPAFDGGEGYDRCLPLVEDLVGEEGVGALSPGDHIEMGAFDFTILWPVSYEEDGGNADSLCMTVTCDVDGDGAVDATMLLMGDAEHPTLARLEDAGVLERVDILKVGHHGSAVSVDDGDLAVLRPQLDLISVGTGNRYGHPDIGTVERLEAAGGVVRRTDEDGEIRVDFGPGGFSVSCDTM